VLRRARRCLRAYRLARRSRAALYQYDSPEFIPWGARLRRASGRPVVFDCMEDFEGYARQRRGVPERIRPALVRLVQWQLRIAARSCDAILVADEGTARLLRPHARRVVVLHNFPQLTLFPDAATAMSDHPYDIVYHGSIPRYHLEVCLAVDAALVQRGYHVRWRFIGWLAESAWLEAELSRRGIRERFCISGAIPHTQIPGEVRKAKLGIIPLPDLPKFQHNIPQKLFEFMALRMPVVLSDLPPSRSFVRDGACAFLVPPDDYAAYADAIIRLLADPALRRRMGAEGRKRVEEEFNWARESQKLIGLYSEVLGG
jgi:glycosyltransferase involved in cell wall biosynthesis